MKNILLLTTATLLLSACQPSGETKSEPTPTKSVETAETTKDVNAELAQWFEDTFMETARRSPGFLARLGMKERMDEWDDPSRAYAIEDLAFRQRKLDELKANFNPEDLDEAHRLYFDLYFKRAEDAIEADKWWDYGYPFNQMFGVQSGIPTFMLNYHRIDNIDDAKAYIARLNGVDEYLGEIVAGSERSADLGIMPPKFVYEHVIRDSENVLTGVPFDDSGDLNLLLNDFKNKVDKLELETADKEALHAEAIAALLTSVKPAYENMIAAMKSQQARTTDDDGAWKLPKGDEYYQWRLERMTTTEMTADEIHDLGLAEVARIQDEMRAIMRQVEFDGTLQEFFTFLKEDPQFTYEDSDAGRQAYLDEATRIIDVMKTRLDDVFLKKPEADLEVRRVEAFREKSAGKAFYNRPAQDGSRPGVYYANLYKITDMPKYQMEALAYHEGIPGHHMQLAISQELEGVPKFQKFGGVTAYTEGWGLYSEYLPKEMGFYEDPYSDFGRLAMEIWRAARLVVDTGLHHKKWTRQQAIDYLLENTPNPENDAIKAIERYIVMPGQATAYKIGMIKILDLREDAKNRLGDAFDIREFHDVILETGPVPLDVLEARVNDWVTSKS